MREHEPQGGRAGHIAAKGPPCSDLSPWTARREQDRAERGRVRRAKRGTAGLLRGWAGHRHPPRTTTGGRANAAKAQHCAAMRPCRRAHHAERAARPAVGPAAQCSEKKAKWPAGLPAGTFFFFAARPPSPQTLHGKNLRLFLLGLTGVLGVPSLGDQESHPRRIFFFKEGLVGYCVDASTHRDVFIPVIRAKSHERV